MIISENVVFKTQFKFFFIRGKSNDLLLGYSVFYILSGFQNLRFVTSWWILVLNVEYIYEHMGSTFMSIWENIYEL